MSVDKYIHRENNVKHISSLAHFVPSSFVLFFDHTVYGNDDKVPRYLYYIRLFELAVNFVLTTGRACPLSGHRGGALSYSAQ
jgi:hypothetical protein